MSTAMGTALVVVGVILIGVLAAIVTWVRRGRRRSGGTYYSRSGRHPYDTWRR